VSRSPAATADVRFSERLWPSPAGWLVAPGLAAAAALVVLPIGPVVPAFAAATTAAATVAFLVATSPRVEVVDGRLRAGRAQIPLSLLGAARAARGEEARQERGPRLDARAYLCIRGWVDPVVRVEVIDPHDPTPYWLVSSRRPDALVSALSRRAE
jgi:Protein of unknown function (DUF3093)